MKILIDTNILVSAVLFPQGVAKRALLAVIEGYDQAMVCTYSIAELHEVFDRKFPDDADLLEEFVTQLTEDVQVVTTPAEALAAETKLRDPDDQPILRAALAAGADLILTGDKDLLDSGLTFPRVVRPREYLENAVTG
ncbi:MAG: putative toxin-antitoxin system toxin component, PIN family [Propionibacteriaceae bacterium]|jgi:putative PIN family toxin of toxin-antitoxin system|nr:putative toxin-antitoxin system toxin component, PIN family [Propionibacteriaceae bacterium]